MKTKKHPIAYAFLLYSISQLALAVTLPVKYDGYLSGSPSYRPGSSSLMSVSTSVKAIMQFDLSALPSGVQASDIEKATLVFYVSSLSRAGKLTVSQITTPWTESALSYNTNLLFSGDPLLTPVIANSASFVSADITPLISGWVDDPLTNNGLILTPAPSYNTGLGIATKESSGRSAYIDVILKGPIFEYKIGDTGPGGGIIFFVDRYDEYPGFTYLEASPEPQPKSTWCDVNTAINIGAVGMAGSIGLGQVNTTNMVNACQSGAGNIADNYSTPTASDWYLPSFQEMVLLMSSVRNLGLYEMNWSVLDAAFFWTSTAITIDSGVIGNFRSVFVVNANTKQTTQFSWPIRSF